jgi:hypothetical protein
MATYTSSSAVQSEFKSVTFGVGTAVTSSDVDEFITQEETALEAEVSQIYEIPITGSRSISLMKMMSTLMVKARILDILPVKTGKPDADQGSGGEALRERVTAMLEKIQKKEIILTDATLRQSSGGVKSYTSDNDITPIFEKETSVRGTPNQW